jgi:hypothetical protein
MAKTIKLSEKEIEMLVENYQFELEQALEYVREVKSFLAKLGATAKVAEEQTPEKKEKEKKKTKRGRKKRNVEVEVKVSEPKKEPVKRGRKARISEDVIQAPAEPAVVLPEPPPAESKKKSAGPKTEKQVSKKVAPKTKKAGKPTPKKKVVAPAPEESPIPAQ